MFTFSTNVALAGSILEKAGKILRPEELRIIEPASQIHYADQSDLRRLVAKEIRDLLLRPDIFIILSVGFHDTDWSYVKGGSIIEKDRNLHTEYVFNRRGPCKEIYSFRQRRRLRSYPDSIELISPEEFLVYIIYPEDFVSHLHDNIEREARNILRQERELIEKRDSLKSETESQGMTQ